MTNPIDAPPASAPRRSRRTALILAGVAGLGLLAAGAVHAHWDRGGWREGGRHGMERGARFAAFCNRDTARFAPVVRAFAKADLRLDGPQAAAFDELADVLLPGLEDLKREACNDFATRGASAPERLKELAANLRAAADLAERSLPSAERFYTSLDENQKRRVDTLAERRGRGSHGQGSDQNKP